MSPVRSSYLQDMINIVRSSFSYNELLQLVTLLGFMRRDHVGGEHDVTR